ncbi:MAG: ATP-binding protein [Clostridiales bacterium]|nr:ATP-binding protein [Clostridiales bacterium]
MGLYLNPGNDAFGEIRNGTYVDKTGLIDFINSTIGTPEKLTCFSRPRRFGKSFAAMMLCAYYDKSCDSRELFEGLEISGSASFEKYLNKYDVVYLDITYFISRSEDIKRIVTDIQTCVIRELRKAYPDCIEEEEKYLPDALASVTQETGNRFFIIIDEWDALFREAKDNDAIQKEYIWFLRGLFKSGVATRTMVAGAYMTGILPIKKYGTESALTDFREYTMVQPENLAEYVGFTEEEVRTLCWNNQLDFEKMRQWYDGYTFEKTQHIYSPNSVIRAVKNQRFGNYWTKSESYESLKNYISMNQDGLKDSVIEMLGGRREKTDVLSFQNDLTNLKSRENVLTLLVHLGYLAYDAKKKEVFIPNLEVSESFRLAVQDTDWIQVGTALSRSEELLDATIRCDSKAVEDALEMIHSENTSILKYNDENSLSCAITIAYYTAKNYYEIFRELPSGKGFADIVFLPHRNTDKPAMIVELKYDKSADTAIQQIKDNRYAGKLNDYRGNLLLVGVNYNKNSNGKKHECVIEKATQY